MKLTSQSIHTKASLPAIMLEFGAAKRWGEVASMENCGAGMMNLPTLL